MSYRHLTPTEREFILVERKLGRTLEKIAIALNRDKGTISRELKRNSINGTYSAHLAQSLYHERRQACKQRPLLENEYLRNLIQKGLKMGWSPEKNIEPSKQRFLILAFSLVCVAKGSPTKEQEPRSEAS